MTVELFKEMLEDYPNDAELFFVIPFTGTQGNSLYELQFSSLSEFEENVLVTLQQ